MSLRPALLSLVEVVSVNRAGQQLGLNLRHYQVTAVGGQGVTLGQIATNVGTVIGPLYQAVMGGGASYQGCLARIVGIGPASPPAWDTIGTGPGIGPGDLLGKQLAGLISWYTAFSGRGNHGRTYVPFPSEGNNDPGGVPSAAYVSGITNIANAWFSVRSVGAIDTSTLTPVLFHRAQGSSTPLLGLAVRSLWATQRRRGDFGRVNPVVSGPIMLNYSGERAQNPAQ